MNTDSVLEVFFRALLQHMDWLRACGTGTLGGQLTFAVQRANGCFIAQAGIANVGHTLVQSLSVHLPNSGPETGKCIRVGTALQLARFKNAK